MGTNDKVEQTDEFPAAKDVGFGPFENHRRCSFEYGGIGEYCSNEATHYMSFEHDAEIVRMYRCDDHGFPFVVRERRRQELGRPVKCEVCTSSGYLPSAANEVDGAVGIVTHGGEEKTYYLCESCAKENDLTLTPL